MSERYSLKPDGEPHVINDEGRTCNCCGDFHHWEEYRILKQGEDQRAAQCRPCTRRKAAARKNKEPEEKRPVFDLIDTPVNNLLMRAWV